MKSEKKKPQENPLQGKEFPKEPAVEGKQSAEYKNIRSKLYAAEVEEVLGIWKENLIPFLRCLKDENINVRMNAKIVFDRIHDEAVRFIIGELQKNNEEFWVVASDALGERALDQPEYDWGPAALTLNRAMRINNSRMHEHASDALVNMGRHAVPILTEDLRSSKNRARWRAATALGKIAENHPEYDWSATACELVISLSDDEEWARQEACKALGKMGKYALEELKKGMKMGSPISRKYFMEAFGLVGDVSAFRILLEAVNDGDNAVRSHAVISLSSIAERNPKEAAAIVTDLINGRMGDELIEISQKNDRIIKALNNVMVVCGVRMRDGE
ncbi:HEAT repeat domain-containing protein [Candidatus Micrarchaeota archaeon]|nr:HEAT repeat domain-containing protein [Candidatus Micrarchaeota archaeon]